MPTPRYPIRYTFTRGTFPAGWAAADRHLGWERLAGVQQI